MVNGRVSVGPLPISASRGCRNTLEVRGDLRRGDTGPRQSAVIGLFTNVKCCSVRSRTSFKWRQYW
jgi:hypothetical protein